MEEKEFPAGMRVLAVDDDSTCLMILAAILRKCQYNVTTTNEAMKALQILQEKKKEFDLVISDVDMPGMDGFELLEQVGRQMDIPVLLLSAHDDEEWVMKGISNGGCHYLVKPVRVEELKHIWQHVVRRKYPKQQVQVLKGTDDQKPNKKRKDENNEEELLLHDHDEDMKSTQKKPRVVWFPELHHKFLAAVNQLGLEKAVPKRILELMNVDNITRENVASHLQKYRMHQKKRNSPQANRFAAAAYGYTSSSYPASQGGVSCSEMIQWGHGADNLLPIIDPPPPHHVHYSSIQPMSQSQDLPRGMLLINDDHENYYKLDNIITPTPEFSSINFGGINDDHEYLLINAPQQELSGNLSFPPKLDQGYNDANFPAVIQFQGPTTPSDVDYLLTDNMAAAAAINPPHHDLISSLNSDVVNILSDTRSTDDDVQRQEQPINGRRRRARVLD